MAKAVKKATPKKASAKKSPAKKASAKKSPVKKVASPKKRATRARPGKTPMIAAFSLESLKKTGRKRTRGGTKVKSNRK